MVSIISLTVIREPVKRPALHSFSEGGGPIYRSFLTKKTSLGHKKGPGEP